MRVRLRPVAIVTTAVMGKTQLQYLALIFEQLHGLIYRAQAGHGELGFDLLVNLLHAGVTLAVRQNLEHCHALRSQATAALVQFFGELVQSE